MIELHNINIEKSILASIFFDPVVFDDVYASVLADDFYLPAHKNIYLAMIELNEAGKPIDDQFIKALLDSKKAFDESAFLDMMAANPLSNISVYCDEVRELASKRRVLKLTTTVKKGLLDDGDDSGDVIDMINKEVDDITNNSGSSSHKTSNQIVDSTLAAMDEVKRTGTLPGVKSGLFGLDSKIGAFMLKDLVIVAARPSMGKTAFVLSVTNNALGNKTGVHLESLEMPGEDIMKRLFSIRSGESLNNIKFSRIENIEAFKSATEFFRTPYLSMNDESYITPAKLYANIKRAVKTTKNLKIVFIDHARYIRLPGKPSEAHSELGVVTKTLKKIAKDYELVIVLLSQLNRENEKRGNKRPMLSDIRDSGAVEEDADLVIAPHRDSYYKSKENGDQEPLVAPADIIVLKARNGETGVAKTDFYGACARFGDGQSVHTTLYDKGDDSIDMVHLP